MAVHSNGMNAIMMNNNRWWQFIAFISHFCVLFFLLFLIYFFEIKIQLLFFWCQWGQIISKWNSMREFDGNFFFLFFFPVSRASLLFITEHWGSDWFANIIQFASFRISDYKWPTIHLINRPSYLNVSVYAKRKLISSACSM